MQNCELLIHAGIIISQNDGREIIEDGGIAIDVGKISAIGAWRDISSEWLGANFLDLTKMLVMPGLINSHAHGGMTFLRGLADDLPLMEWLTGTVFPVEARLTPEITRLGALLGHAEMLATGTTSCIDMYIYESEVLEAAEISGIRCLGGEAIFQFPSAACASWREALAETAGLADKYAGHDRISVAVNPHSVYTTTPEILHACRDLANDLDLPLHIHLAETRSETETCVKTHNLRPVAYCASLGLFDVRVIAAHLVDITENEARFLAKNNTIGVHNPSSNMKLASGVAPVLDMLAAGLPLGLGTDGPASNNQLNMFTEMGRAALLHKLAQNNPAALAAQVVLDMATRGGAQAIGNPGLGRLAPGAPADLIALDLRKPNLQPLHNAVSQAVYAASGHEVALTMVAGEILYLDGRYSRFDYQALLEEIDSLHDFIRQKK